MQNLRFINHNGYGDQRTLSIFPFSENIVYFVYYLKKVIRIFSHMLNTQVTASKQLIIPLSNYSFRKYINNNVEFVHQKQD